jgi:hypothetical protein
MLSIRFLCRNQPHIGSSLNLILVSLKTEEKSKFNLNVCVFSDFYADKIS